MSRNHKDDSPQRRAEPEQPMTKPNENVERDPMKVPKPQPDAKPGPAERSDLIWAEHED